MNPVPPPPYAAPPAAPRSGLSTVLIGLVVVGIGGLIIVAILAAILFPVFAQARLAAQKTQSISYLKQLGLAGIMYVGDHDGYPLAANWTESVQPYFSFALTGPTPRPAQAVYTYYLPLSGRPAKTVVNKEETPFFFESFVTSTPPVGTEKDFPPEGVWKRSNQANQFGIVFTDGSARMVTLGWRVPRQGLRTSSSAQPSTR